RLGRSRASQKSRSIASRQRPETSGRLGTEESANNLTSGLPVPRIVAPSTPSKLVMRQAPPGAGDAPRGGRGMEQGIERGAGLDVHKATIAACVRVPGPRGGRSQHLQTFGTTAGALVALRDWLESHGVTHVALESTGVYWKPVYYVLEESFTCLVVN